MLTSVFGLHEVKYEFIYTKSEISNILPSYQISSHLSIYDTCSKCFYTRTELMLNPINFLMSPKYWCLSCFCFLRPVLSPWGYRNKCFLVVLCCYIVRDRKKIVRNLEEHPKGFSISRSIYWHSLSSCIRWKHVLSLVTWVFPKSLGATCYSRSVLSNGHKKFQGSVFHELTAYFLIFTSLWLNEMVMLLKYINQKTLNDVTL